MLSPEDIQAIANDITSIYSQVESECIASVVKHITAGKNVTQASIWQMKKLDDVGLLRRDLLKGIKAKTTLSVPEVEKLVKTALNKSLGVDIGKVTASLEKYREGSKSEFLKNVQNSEQFKTVVNQCLAGCKDVINLTNTSALQASLTAYTSAINQAYLEMSTGLYRREDAIKNAVDKIAKSGIKIVDDKSKATGNELVKRNGELFTTYGKGGDVHLYPLDSAIRRDLVTTINKSAGTLTLAVCKDVGATLVETSWHVGARPEHEVWQGRVFSLDPNDTRYPYFYAPQEAGGTGYGDMLGLCGINCYHSFDPYFEGSPVADQTHKPTAEENAKAYKEQQQQRAYERRLRGLKREQVAYMAGGYTEDAQKTQQEINKVSKKYRQFLTDTGRTRISILEHVGGYKPISTKAGATVTPQNPKAIKQTPAPRVSTNPNDYKFLTDTQANREYARQYLFEPSRKNLTQTELDSITTYTGSSYRPMNDALRFGVPASRDIATLNETVSKALDKCTLPENLRLVRGIGKSDILEKYFNIPHDVLMSEQGSKALIGKTFSDKAFLSTALDGGFDKQVTMEILAPKGSKGLYIAPISHFPNEYELLLQKDSKFQILDVILEEHGRIRLKVLLLV